LQRIPGCNALKRRKSDGIFGSRPLTIYHLLKKLVEVGRLSPVENLLAAAGLKEIPQAKVACLVGTALHPTTHRTF
jgi:hypothetical protein